MALFPSCSPSTMPAAMASTFFSAPAISTPTTSSLRLTRRQGLASMADACCASSTLSEAATIMVGRPCISSTANEGPDSTTMGCLRSSDESMISVMIWPVPTCVRIRAPSRPLSSAPFTGRGCGVQSED